MRPALLSLAVAALLVSIPVGADDAKPADGYVPMFNGKDLSGWVNVNCAPSTFFVKDGEIITTGKPTGFLRTEKQYENFELEMDWMHINTKEVGNSGLFVWGDPLPAVGTGYTRGIEVQVLVNLEYRDKKTNAITATSHGDLFSIWGATCVPDRPHPTGAQRCLPSENRAKGGGEWNHYKVIANDGVIKLHVNGKEVSGVSKCNPRKGYLALESEDAECHFKNLKIKELPSTNPKPEEIAKVAEGHTSLFNGLDLTGWKTKEGAWKASDGKLAAMGKATLSTEKNYDKCELIFDWRRPAKSDGQIEVEVGGITLTALEGRISTNQSPGLGISVANGSFVFPGKQGVKPGVWNRATITLDGKSMVVAINGQDIHRAPATDLRTKPISFKAADGLEIMNVFYRELK
jgi:hypothetical protein